MTEFDPTREVQYPKLREEPEEETPPSPAFLITPNAYGAGTRSRVQFPDGTHVGIWLHEQKPHLSPDEVKELLLSMGLPEEEADGFRRDRVLATKYTEEAFSSTAVQDMMASEVQREKDLKPIREAFVKAQQKKQS